MTMSLGVLRAGGQRVQQGRASTNDISATLTQLNRFSHDVMADQLQLAPRATGMERQQFPSTPKSVP